MSVQRRAGEGGGGADLSTPESTTQERHTRFHAKDIVQPKKRGVKRGTIRFVLTSYTIADIFLTLKGLISRRKLQKTGFSV